MGNEKLKLWGQVLLAVESQINKQPFEMWFQETEIAEINGSTIKIKVADDVAKNVIKDNYSQTIEEAIEKASGVKYTCEYMPKNMFEASQSEEIPIVIEA